MAPIVGPALSTRARGHEAILVALAVGIVGVTAGLPLLVLALGATSSPSAGSGFAWSHFVLLGRSLVIALGTALGATALGIGVAVTVATRSLPRPVATGVLCVHGAVALVPPTLPALGFFHLFSLQGTLGSEASSAVLFSTAGVIGVLTLALSPLVTGLTWVGLAGIDRSIVASARTSLGGVRAIRQILLPAARPAIGLAFVAVFALAFSELGVPSLLRVDVFPSAVFARMAGAGLDAAGALSFVLPALLVSGALLVAERRFGLRSALGSLGARGITADMPALPRRTASLAGTFSICVGVASLAPFVALGIEASGASIDDVSVWLGDTAWSSLRAASVGALVACLSGCVVGYGLARGARWACALDVVSMLAFVVPGPILSVALARFWNRPWGATVYDSFLILSVGWAARYGILSARSVAASVARLPRSFEDASRAAGAGFSARLALSLGATRPAVLASFALPLAFSLRDLDATIAHYPPGGEPLAVRIFTLEANGPPPVVAALALALAGITLASLASVVVAGRLVWRR